MGTRALIHVKDNVWFLDEGKEPGTLVTIFRHWDGNPDGGLGDELKELCKDVRIVNGFSGDDAIPATFNGMGCFAAWLIGKLRGDQIGNVSVSPVDEEDVGEEYTYTIRTLGDGSLEVTYV